MEQRSIFDEHFSEGIKVRRRDIMPLTLKIYSWFGIVLGILLTLFGIEVLRNAYMQDKFSVSLPIGLIQAASSIVFGMVIFLLGYLHWMEVKWAIRFTWGVIGIWFLLMIFNAVSQGIAGLTSGLAGILFIPCWVIQYRIQKRWEHDAVSRKELVNTNA